ncbi:unnamed protein product [Didymodactylos carnosus]|uniref:Tudor domain-containing protein n=1 Tax=Didymodactylos carnosus TaxID=1234261 RepID=A0A813TLA4_9BILA|nr:unnamed protein product [Didymodactylos carnosus]CAF3596644.1 unnamed protein product [Didymodactylos carnosus]
MKVTSKRVHIQKSKYRLPLSAVSHPNALLSRSSVGSHHRSKTVNNQIMNSSSAASSSKAFGVAGACSLALGTLLFGSYWLGNKRASNNCHCLSDQQQQLKKKLKQNYNDVNQSVSLTSTTSSGYHSISNTAIKQDQQQSVHCSCCPFSKNNSEINGTNVEHYCDSLAQEILTTACKTTNNVYPHLARYLLFTSNNNNNQIKKVSMKKSFSCSPINRLRRTPTALVKHPTITKNCQISTSLDSNHSFQCYRTDSKLFHDDYSETEEEFNEDDNYDEMRDNEKSNSYSKMLSCSHPCNNSTVTDKYLSSINNDQSLPLKTKLFLTDPSTTATMLSSDSTDDLILSYLKQTCDQQCQTDDVYIIDIRPKTNDQEIQTIFSPSLQHKLTIVSSTSLTTSNEYPKIEHDEFGTKITYDNIVDSKLENKMPRSSSIESGLIDCSDDDHFCLTTINDDTNNNNEENEELENIIDQTNENIDQVLPSTPSSQLIENEKTNDTREDEQILNTQLIPTSKRLWIDIIDETTNDEKENQTLSTKSENNDANVTETVQQLTLTNGYHNEPDQTPSVQLQKTLTKPRVTTTIDHLPPQQTDNGISSSSTSSLSPTTTPVNASKGKQQTNKSRYNNYWYSYDYGCTNGKENNYYSKTNNSSHPTKKDQIKMNGTTATTPTSSTVTIASKQLVDNTNNSNNNNKSNTNTATTTKTSTCKKTKQKPQVNIQNTSTSNELDKSKILSSDGQDETYFFDDQVSMTKDQEIIIYEFHFPIHFCGRLIGKQGVHVDYIRQTTQVDLVVRDDPVSWEKQIVALHGRRADVEKALNSIAERFPPSIYKGIVFKPIHKKIVLRRRTPERFVVSPASQLYLSDTTMTDIIVTSIVSCNHIFVQQLQHPSYTELVRLDNSMSLFYTHTEMTPLLPRPIQPGVICAAPTQVGWFRALITDYNSDDDMAMIKFLDYGGYLYIHANTLRVLRQDFMFIPFQAAEVYLDSVLPVDGQDDFLPEQINAVKSSISGNVLKALITGYHYDGLAFIQLTRPDDYSGQIVNIEIQNIVNQLTPSSPFSMPSSNTMNIASNTINDVTTTAY